MKIRQIEDIISCCVCMFFLSNTFVYMAIARLSAGMAIFIPEIATHNKKKTAHIYFHTQ